MQNPWAPSEEHEGAWHHLFEWMKLQEEANRELTMRLLKTEQALIHLMHFCGLIDSTPPTEEDEQWARRLIAEGRHEAPSHPHPRGKT